MYIKRIPAMRAANINPQDARHPGSLTRLPSHVRAATDNYNHLHEQPTVFYALVIYGYLAGTLAAADLWLAWIYVGLRIVHSLVQITANIVMLRFLIFAASSLVLVVMAARQLMAL
jgi:hypothetical protein